MNIFHFSRIKLMDSLETFVRQKVPRINDQEIQKVLQKFQELGVTTIEDVEDVKEDDLTNVLPPIKARQLLKPWKTGKC